MLRSPLLLLLLLILLLSFLPPSSASASASPSSDPLPESCPPPPPTVLLLVNSALGNRDRRNAIRATWGKDLPDSYTLLFVLGADAASPSSASPSSVPSYDPALNELTLPIVDLYRNNVLKLLSLLSHFSAAPPLPHAYALKLDDDSYLDPLRFLSSLPPTVPEMLYKGMAFTGVPVRDVLHKNYVSESCFPAQTLPAYAYGAGVLLSWDVLELLIADRGNLSKDLIRSGGDEEDEDCCDLDDVQLSMWLKRRGVELTHTRSFSGKANCHAGTVLLFDVLPDLALEIRSAGGDICGGPVQRENLRLPGLSPSVTAVRLILLGDFSGALSSLSLPSAGPRDSSNRLALLPLADRCASKGEGCEELTAMAASSVSEITRRMQVPEWTRGFGRDELLRLAGEIVYEDEEEERDGRG